MFGLASGIYQSYFSTPQLNVLLLGAESVGKTTMLERIKVTQFSKRAPPVNRATSFQFSSCPAPLLPKYANAKLLDNDNDNENYYEEDEEDEQTQQQDEQEYNDANDHDIMITTQTNVTKRWLSEKQQSSLEDVPCINVQESNESNSNHNKNNKINNGKLQQEQHDDDDDEEDDDDEPQDFDLKPGCKMLPLDKIRPTSKYSSFIMARCSMPRVLGISIHHVSFHRSFVPLTHHHSLSS